MNVFADAARRRSATSKGRAAVAPKDRSAIYYSETGFNTLYNAVKAHNNPNENYYFVVNPDPLHKTTVRPAVQYTQYETSPNIHPVVEFNKDAWNKMPGTWAQKGQEFRQEMIQAGLPANTMWAVNEFGHGIRNKGPASRREMAALVGALSNEGPRLPRDRGIVFQQGPGYVQGLGHELKDNTFWKAMHQDVWKYMPEAYVGPKRYLPWSEQQRQQYIFGADKGLARREFAPMMSGFWGGHAYGTEHVPLHEMQRFVALQMAQARNRPVFGIAWNEHPVGGTPAEMAALANTIVARG